MWITVTLQNHPHDIKKSIVATAQGECADVQLELPLNEFVEREITALVAMAIRQIKEPRKAELLNVGQTISVKPPDIWKSS